VRRYEETYAYDEVGHFLVMAHTMVGDPTGSWTRRYDYGDGGSNRLRSTDRVGDTTAPYSDVNAYDVHGNMVAIGSVGFSGIGYTPFDQMCALSLGGGGD